MELRQLAADARPAAPGRGPASTASVAATRRGDSNATSVSSRAQHRLELAACGAAGSRRTATSRPACRSRRARSARRSGPGSTSTASPAATRACTRTSPGSLTSGIPASLTSATVSPAQHPLDEPRRGAALVVLVVAHALGGHAVAVEQHLARARVLARDDVRLAQRRERAQRDVLEVADRRRADDRAAPRRQRSPRELLEGQRRGAEQPGVRAEARRDDLDEVAHRAAARARRPPRAPARAAARRPRSRRRRRRSAPG